PAGSFRLRDRDNLGLRAAVAGTDADGVLAGFTNAGFPEHRAVSVVLAQVRHRLQLLAFDAFNAGGKQQGQRLAGVWVSHDRADREEFPRLHRAAQRDLETAAAAGGFGETFTVGVGELAFFAGTEFLGRPVEADRGIAVRG